MYAHTRSKVEEVNKVPACFGPIFGDARNTGGLSGSCLPMGGRERERERERKHVRRLSLTGRGVIEEPSVMGTRTRVWRVRGG